MSEIVKCDVCGQIYNQSYLHAHKRLAHGKRLARAHPANRDREVQDAIVSMYAGLSEQSKKEVRGRLETPGEIPEHPAPASERKRSSRNKQAL